MHPTFEPLEPRNLFSVVPHVLVPDAAAADPPRETPRQNSDFNGDGFNDIVFRDLDVGFNNIKIVVDGVVIGEQALRGWNDTEWRIVGVADLTGDGNADILFRNIETGANRIWKMEQNARVDEIDIPRLGPNWRLGGLGDFTGDGHIDLFWRNTKTGQNVVWQMNNSTFVRGHRLRSLPNKNWLAVGVGDFTGDGKPDILYRHQVTGDNVVWRMNGKNYVRGHIIHGRDNLEWQVGDVRDFDDDGDADIVLRNLATGETEIWIMSRLVRADRDDMPSYPVNWQPPGTNVGPFGSNVTGSPSPRGVFVSFDGINDDTDDKGTGLDPFGGLDVIITL